MGFPAREEEEEQRWLDALERGELDDNGELKKEVDESLLTARQVRRPPWGHGQDRRRRRSPAPPSWLALGKREGGSQLLTNPPNPALSGRDPCLFCLPALGSRRPTYPSKAVLATPRGDWLRLIISEGPCSVFQTASIVANSRYSARVPFIVAAWFLCQFFDAAVPEARSLLSVPA